MTDWEQKYKRLIKYLVKHKDTSVESWGDTHDYGYWIPESTIKKWCNEIGFSPAPIE